MTSPLLSTTSRLPLSLEFSEESSSDTRSGTVPVTRITSTWRRPATWVNEQEEHVRVQRYTLGITSLRQKFTLQLWMAISGSVRPSILSHFQEGDPTPTLPEPDKPTLAPATFLSYSEPNLSPPDLLSRTLLRCISIFLSSGKEWLQKSYHILLEHSVLCLFT